MSSSPVVGTKVADAFGVAKVTGKWTYPADRVYEGLLYTRILGSPYPHAKITAIDTSAAEALPGVKAVITYKDAPSYSLYGCHNPFTQELFYVGQEVAAIAATDPNIAEDAVELINVTYQQLPFVTDIAQAIQSGSPLSGLVPGTNIAGTPSVYTRGDTTAGFAKADVTFEDNNLGPSCTFSHSNIIPRSCIANWDDSANSKLTIYTTSQYVFSARDIVAQALKLNESDVRIVSIGTGGAFGNMIYQHEWLVTAAALAKKAGLPVLNHLSRHDYYLTAGRHPHEIADIKAGVMKDGTIVAMEASMFGGMPSFGPIQGTYKIPNLKTTGTTVMVNLPQNTAWRGPDEMVGAYLMETFIDELAEKVNMDPVQFRLKNAITAQDKDLPTGLPFSSMGLVDCLQSVASKIGWSSKWHAPGTKQLPDGRYHGIGVAINLANKGYTAGYSSVTVMAARDGTFLLSSGVTACQGTPTGLCMIAADALGVPLDSVKMANWGDTNAGQDCGGQGGSTRTITVGQAVQAACQDLKNQIFPLAAKKLGVTVDQLDVSNGQIYLKSDPTKFVSYHDLLFPGGVGWWSLNMQPIGRGYNAVPTDRTTKCGTATAVEVAVDVETGKFEVLSAYTADDCGKAVNVLGVECQIEGAIVETLGFTTSWKWEFDHSIGFGMNPSLLDQKPLTMLDVPAPSNFGSIIVEKIDSVGPFGAKGVSEPPIAPPGPAICNAIYNATGKRVNQQGVTPAVLLKSLGKA